MTEHSIVVRIEGTETASQLFHDVSKAAEDAGKKVDKSFNEKLTSLGQTSTDLGKKMTIGVTTPLTLVGGVAVDAAMKAERLRTSLEGLAGGADQAAGYIEGIKAASLGTISELDAMAFSTKALTLDVVDNAEEMARLTEIAITLGRAQGLTATQAVGDLTDALGRQSPLILDNLGITLKMSEAHQIYADQLNKSVSDLSEAEKQQAFLNAALIKGEEVAANLGGVTLDSAAKLEQMKAQASDLAVEFGSMLLPALESGVDVLSDVLGWFAGLDETSKQLVVTLGLVAAGAGPALAAFGSMATLVAKIPTSMGALNAALATTQVQMLAVGGAAVALIAAYKAFKDFQADIAEGQEKLNQQLETWEQRTQALIDSGAPLAEVYATMGEKIQGASEAHDKGGIVADVFIDKQAEIGKAVREANEIVAATSDDYAEYQAGVEAVNAQVEDANLRILSYAEAEEKANRIRQSSGVHMSRQAAMAQVLREHTVALSEAEFAQAQAAEAAAQHEERRLQMLEQSAAATDETAAVVEELTEATYGYDSAGEQFQRQLMSMKDRAGEAEEAILAQAEADRQAAATASMAAASIQAQADAAASVEEMLRKMAAAEARAAGEAVNLATSLKGATDAQIAGALTSMLDPEEMGAEAFLAAATDIGIQFGTMDEESIALAENLPNLAAALEDQVVPAENAGEALSALIEDADDGTVSFENLLTQFGNMPEAIEPITSDTERMGELFTVLGEDAAPAAERGVSDFQGAVETARQPTMLLRDEVSNLRGDLEELTAQTWTVNITSNTTATGSGGTTDDTGIPAFQHGGVVPGPIGQPQLVIAHGGERFLGASSAHASSGSGGSEQNVNLNISVTVAPGGFTPAEAGAQVAREVVREARARGVRI